jgi:glycine cleavage system H lipoate-binding protein
LLPSNPEPGRNTRSEVFDQDVGNGSEAEHYLGRVRMLEVDADIAFASVLLVIEAREAANVLAPVAGDVTLGWFDLDDVGAQVREHATGEGA